MSDFFSFRTDPQGNHLAYYELIPLGVAFQVSPGVWCADCTRNNDWSGKVPDRLRGMMIGFVDKEHCAFYLYRLWITFSKTG